jgi:hypothetical protein
MSGAKYAIHHVGGRWGNTPFPHLKHFTNDFVQVLYEADSDAIDTMRTAENASQPETFIISSCLAGAAGERTLNLTFNPGGTSLLEPAENVRELYRALRGIDFDLDSGLEVVERRTLRGETLDQVIAAVGCPPADFLCMDTQGTEYEILCGGRSTLSNVCGLIIEVEFIELYKNQKRFQEVYDLLDSEGFYFTRFEQLGEVAGPRQPIGFRGRGRQIWADALFLRRPVSVSEPRQLVKLAFTSLVFGHIESALECLDRVNLDEFDSALQGLRYPRFLKEIKAAYGEAKKIFPPLFGKVLPRSCSSAFASAQPEEWTKLFDLEEFATAEYLGSLDELSQQKETVFESVLNRYGLAQIASDVAEMRIDQASKTKDAILAYRRPSMVSQAADSH